jgi:hypothetical protein
MSSAVAIADRFEDVRHLRDWFMEHPDDAQIASDYNLRRTLLYAFRWHRESQILDFDVNHEDSAIADLHNPNRVRRIRQAVEGLCRQSWFIQHANQKYGIIAIPATINEHVPTPGPIPKQVFAPIGAGGFPVVFVPPHLVLGAIAFMRMQRNLWTAAGKGHGSAVTVS